MRSRPLAALIIAIVAAVVMSAPVLSVTNGQPDGNRHPFVGLLIQFIPNTDLIAVCSGSALSPTRFLTAAHCADPTLPVLITYKSTPPYSLASDFSVGTFHPHPDWCLGCGPGLQQFDKNDVAVVALSTPRDPGSFATLPLVGLVDSLAMGTPVDLVGYGAQGIVRGRGRPSPLVLLTRYFAPTLLIASHNIASAEFIKLTANPALTGGVCFGDSGGPDLLGGTNIVLAVNSYVTNNNCTGVTYSTRVDLAAIQAFINSI